VSALAYPELPAGARPRWPAWMAPAAFFSAFGVTIAAGFPLLPVALLTEAGDAVAGVALLVLILVQDAALVGVAVFFASRRVKPQPWHFGLRSTRFWVTAGLVLLAGLLILGFEVGITELFGTDAPQDDLSSSNIIGAIAVGLAVIVVAPVTEELFFRGFFYRALRTRMRVVWAVLIDSLVFASIHVQYIGTPEVFIVIGGFAAVACLVYEKTGSIFATIALHAAFNTVASLSSFPAVSIVIGVLMLIACILVPRRLGPAPSPFPA
jgi:membrane protease YdiL (CAAX protease family)